MKLQKETEFEKEIKDAFHKISGNLQYLPNKFCRWKKNSGEEKKYLRSDYLPIFSFVSDPILRQNLAELRMCLDYQWSIYDLLKPGLTFERQHKLVIYQIVGSIYEGIMFEYMVAYTEREKNEIVDFLMREKANNRGFGLGSMIELFYQAGLIDKSGKEYLLDVNFLRNTVHPRSFNKPEATYEKNKLLSLSINKIIENLDRVVSAVEKRITNMRADKVPF